MSVATASLIGGTVGGNLYRLILKQGLAGVIAGHPFDTIKVYI